MDQDIDHMSLDSAVAILARNAGMSEDEVRDIASKTRTISEEAADAYQAMKGIFRVASRAADREEFRDVVTAWHTILNR